MKKPGNIEGEDVCLNSGDNKQRCKEENHYPLQFTECQYNSICNQACALPWRTALPSNQAYGAIHRMLINLSSWRGVGRGLLVTS